MDFKLASGYAVYEVEEDYREGQFYNETPDATTSQLEALRKALDTSSSMQREQISSSSSNSQPNKTANPSQAKFILLNNTPLYNLYTARQHSEILQSIDKVLKLTKEIISSYAPSSYGHPLLQKVWGSLIPFITVSIASVVFTRAS